MAYNLLGAQWSQPARVTFSIMPDGTDLGGVPSNLQATLDGNPNTAATWRQLVRKSAAAWEFYGNVQLVQVPDDGSPLGFNGNQQNDSRFGDIRIGGYAQSLGQLAFAFAPPPFNGGTAAGDIVFNTSQQWNTSGSAYDFYSVMTHEFGHSLGLNHATTTNAMMYAVYNTSKRSMAADDQNGIKAIYGSQVKDAFDAAAWNNNSNFPSVITSYLDGNGQISLPGLTTHTSGDVDWYQVTVPANTTGTMTVRMQASALSSVMPAVQIWSNSFLGTLLGSDTSQTDYSTTATVTLSGVIPGQVYKIRAMPNTTAPGAVGAYGLQVNFGSEAQLPIAPPDTTVAQQPDQNPSSYPEGVGWKFQGIFTRFKGDLGSDENACDTKKPKKKHHHDDDGLYRANTSNGSGYGDALMASDLGLNARAFRFGSLDHAMLPDSGFASGDLVVIDPALWQPDSLLPRPAERHAERIVAALDDWLDADFPI